MPAEFFHPAVSASQKGQEKGPGTGTLPKIALQGSWASLRSPSVNCSLLRQVWTPPRLHELSCLGAGGHLSGALMYRWRRRGRSGGREVWPARPPVLHWLELPTGHAEGTKHRAERLFRARSPRARISRSCPSSHVYGGSRAGPVLAQLLVPARCLAVCEARGQQIQNPYPMAYAVLFSACVAGVREERVSQSKCVKIIYLRVIPGREKIAPGRDYEGGAVLGAGKAVRGEVHGCPGKRFPGSLGPGLRGPGGRGRARGGW